MTKKKYESEIKQGILGLCIGSIEGFVITKRGVIRKKKDVPKRRKTNK
jgi:hypothetical protein